MAGANNYSSDTYRDSLVRKHYDRDGRGFLNRQEILTYEKFKELGQTYEFWEIAPQILKDRWSELACAEIVEDNRVDAERSQEAVAHIPVERRPFVL